MFQITVLSAEKQLYSGTATSVTAPTESGEITILPHHTVLVTNLHAGELIVRREDKEEERIFIGGGVLEFTPKNECRVLADVAMRVDEIDEKAAEEARQRAEESLKHVTSERDAAAAQAALFHALMQLRIAEKRRKFRK